MVKHKKNNNYFFILLFASSLGGLIFLVYLHLLTFLAQTVNQDFRQVVVWWAGITFILIAPSRYGGNQAWKERFGKISMPGKVSLLLTGIYGIANFVIWGLEETVVAQERFLQVIFGFVFLAAALSAWSRIKFKKKKESIH